MPQGTPDPTRVLRGHAGEVQALAIDEEERFLFSGDSHGEIRVWDLQDMRPTATRRLHPPAAGVLSLRLIGRRALVSQGRDGVTHVWALDSSMQPSEQPIRSFFKDAYSFCRCSVLPLDHRIGGGEQAAGEGDGAGGEPTGPVAAAAEAVAAAGDEDSVSVTPAGMGAAGVPGQAGGAAAAGEPAEGPGQQSERQPAHPGSGGSEDHPCLSGCCSAAGPSGSGGGSDASSRAPAPRALLAIADDEGKDAEVWCCACGRRLAHAKQADLGSDRKLGMVLALRLYRREGRTYLAAGYESGDVVVWALAAVGAGAPASVAAPAAAPAAAGVTGSAAEQRACAPQAPPSLTATPVAHRHLFAEPVMAVEVGPDGGGGVAGSAEDKLVCFRIDCAAGKLAVKHTVDLHKQGIADLAIRADGRLLATAGWDGRVRLYKMRTGQPLAVLRYHRESATALAFGPRSQALATAARDGTIALWDIYRPSSAAPAP